MDWIFNHLQIVLAVAAALAYWVNQMKEKGAGGKDGDPVERPIDAAQAESENLERTRRIQEEIRRKIAERRGTAAPPPLPPAHAERPLAPPLVAPRPVAGSMGGLRERLEAKLAEMQARETARAAAQARQQHGEAEARLLEAEKLAAQQRATAGLLLARKDAQAAAAVQAAAVAPGARPSRAWVDELRDPQSVRRAMVLREVLGAPVGLR